MSQSAPEQGRELQEYSPDIWFMPFLIQQGESPNISSSRIAAAYRASAGTAGA